MSDRLNQRLFNALYRRSLVYNTCWEDPAVDRQALDIGPEDRMLVITSAGCNVLDYALCAPARIHAVDANPRQTALLELKLAGIRCLAHNDFFDLFGAGFHPKARQLYHDALRANLSPFARHYWDQRVHWFCRGQGGTTFYYFGLAGMVARLFRSYLSVRPRLRGAIHRLFAAGDLEEQRARYDAEVAPYLWSRSVRWTLSRPFTMSLLGVPHPQREAVACSHQEGIAGFVRDAVEYVFRSLPVADNYFWAVYVRGHYTPSCCPEYLKPGNFAALKGGLAERILPHTGTVTRFLQTTEERLSRFVLLDHMDWMSVYHPAELAEEWQAIMDRATPEARVIFRSAHPDPVYLRNLVLPDNGPRLTERLCYHRELAARLHAQDRVHTYAGFHVASVTA
jgi:S-adenosylmethionine-diacylglycerol 3-amino-3-carboxypropyl transferase